MRVVETVVAVAEHGRIVRNRLDYHALVYLGYVARGERQHPPRRVESNRKIDAFKHGICRKTAPGLHSVLIVVGRKFGVEHETLGIRSVRIYSDFAAFEHAFIVYDIAGKLGLKKSVCLIKSALGIVGRGIRIPRSRKMSSRRIGNARRPEIYLGAVSPLYRTRLGTRLYHRRIGYVRRYENAVGIVLPRPGNLGCDGGIASRVAVAVPLCLAVQNGSDVGKIFGAAVRRGQTAVRRRRRLGYLGIARDFLDYGFLGASRHAESAEGQTCGGEYCYCTSFKGKFHNYSLRHSDTTCRNALDYSVFTGYRRICHMPIRPHCIQL